MDDEETIRRLHRARGTVFEMLRDRGYEIRAAPCDLIEFQRRVAAQKKEEIVSALALRGHHPRKPILCFFFPLTKIGIGNVREVLVICKKEKIRHAMVCYESVITPFAMQNLQQLTKGEEPEMARMETFSFDQLQMNPTKHELVPRHELLVGREALAELSKRSLVQTELPRMLPTDAIARYYGAHRGNLFRISRYSPEGAVVEALRVVSG